MAESHTQRIRHKDRAEAPPPAAKSDAGSADQAKAERESREQTVSEPGGFANDPDDATNPNEVIERHRRKLRR
jgi:hypothetical protein